MADYHKSWFFHGHFKSRIRNFNKKLRALARHYLYKYFPELYQRPITVDELKKKGLIGLSDELRFDISSDINIDDIYLTPLGENNIIQFQKSSNDNSLQRKYILVTDASFERLTYKSTLGFYIIDKQGIEGRPMKRIIKTKSSIDAEMQSMILALKYCRKRNIDEIIHISDCKAAIRALQDFYPLKNPRLNRNIKKIKEITASFKIISHYYVNRTFPLLQKADEITKDSV
jgi:ribonuclease HI